MMQSHFLMLDAGPTSLLAMILIMLLPVAVRGTNVWREAVRIAARQQNDKRVNRRG